jgi:hypothetical protein
VALAIPSFAIIFGHWLWVLLAIPIFVVVHVAWSGVVATKELYYEAQETLIASSSEQAKQTMRSLKLVEVKAALNDHAQNICSLEEFTLRRAGAWSEGAERMLHQSVSIHRWSPMFQRISGTADYNDFLFAVTSLKTIALAITEDDLNIRS